MAAVDVKWAEEDEGTKRDQEATLGTEGERPAETSQGATEASPATSETAPAAADTPAAEAADGPVSTPEDALPSSTTSAETVPTVAKGNTMLHTAIEAVLLLAVIGLALWSWTLASDRHNLQRQLQAAQTNPQALVQKQSDDLIAKVGKLMNLPAGETPTVANVTDVSAAKQQSNFFAQAQNGDKVLLYAKAGEAILYRPSTNKIILVAPLTFNSNQAAAQPGKTSATTPAATGSTTSTPATATKR